MEQDRAQAVLQHEQELERQTITHL